MTDRPVTGPDAIRVVVADDQALVRSGIRMILDLEHDLEVVGEAADGAQAVDVAGRRRPDVIVMDVRMPKLDGIAATARITSALPRCHVLILTTFSADRLVYEALTAGASGFVLKDSSREHLLHAVRTVAAGEALLDPSLTRRFIERFVASPVPSEGTGDVPASLRSLSARELEVLRLVARGRSNGEIAGELFLSEATVKTYVARMQVKLGLRDRIHAVVTAYESGLVRPGS